MPSIHCVLFDLDGTLADTAPGLHGALEALAAEHDLPAPAASEVRSRISLGTEAMLRLVLPLPGAIPAAAKTRFLLLYQERIATGSRLFPGLERVLQYIEDSGKPWGVVSNKAERLSREVLRAIGLAGRHACLVGGDTLAQRKPDPSPLLLACRQMQAEPGGSVYVGDARQDVQAGLRAGMRALAAAYGYLPARHQVQSWGAEAVLQSPLELLDWLQQHG